MTVRIIQGDCREVLPTIEAQTFGCCMTSPPYWGLRDYGVDGRLGLETTPEEYIEKMVSIFREVRRVLWNRGTLWLNMGDTYISGKPKLWNGESTHPDIGWSNQQSRLRSYRRDRRPREDDPHKAAPGLKAKDMAGIPWRVALALQADGWYLRSDIIWAKPNPMPESVTDRPTKSHEHVFLLAKQENYYYDGDAIREECRDVNVGAGVGFGQLRSNDPSDRRNDRVMRYKRKGGISRAAYDQTKWLERTDGSKGCRPPMTMGDREYNPLGRNKHDVWTMPTEAYKGAHFATFPKNLARPCILAGCPQGGEVMDPLSGSGTVGEVAEEEGRNSTLIELKPEYIQLAQERTAQRGLFCWPQKR